MAFAAPAISLASTAMSAVGGIQQGEGQAKADEFQAQRALEASQYGRIKAAQTGTILTQNMTNALGRIAAVRASAGSDIRSPTTAAIRANQEQMRETQRGTELGNIFAQVRMDQLSAQQYTDAATRALQGGYLGAAGKVLGGLGGAFSSSGSGAPGSMFSFWGGANANPPAGTTSAATPGTAAAPQYGPDWRDLAGAHSGFA
jgi:hypothetical protein